MARTGRPKKPTAIKKLAGTWRKDRHAKVAEWRPPEGAPPMPDGLAPGEAREWRRLVALLLPAGVLTLADGDALEAYVKALELARRADAIVRKESLVVVTDEGQTKANPAVNIARDARLATKQFGALFGLDPSSRASLNVSGSKPKEDPVEADLFGHGLKVIPGG